MTRFIGRKKELDGLKGLLKKKIASLVVIRGRRRVGKSRLSEEFSFCFPRSYSLTGLPPEKGVLAQDQRDEFARQLQRLGIPITTAENWGDLFTDFAEHCKTGRVLIILDEITWMGDLDPTFLPKLKTIWDLYFKKNPELVLLISGSNSSWIEKNLLSSTGFVGRISYQIYLKELPLHYCNEFWSNSKDWTSAYEKFKILAITGGIPRYLEEIRTDLSAEQNIFALCYQSSGLLFHEFDQIFSDLFSQKNQIYKEIVMQIANGAHTLDEIAKGVQYTKGGDFSQLLHNLVEAGFLCKDHGWDIAKTKEGRSGQYRICDNYIRFYLKYIEPYKNRIATDKLQRLPPGWKSIMGLQFENLICNNFFSLAEALELNSDEVIWAGPYFQTATTRRLGCQIDYLIQTKHNVLYLCEVKFSEREIPFGIVKEVSEKAKRLKVPKGFSLRFVLIHVNGVSEGIEHEDFFAHMINFGDFLQNTTKQ